MQEHYGSKVYIAAADWNVMETLRLAKEATKRVLRSSCLSMTKWSSRAAYRARDFRMNPGSHTGHTPGAMGYIFP